MTTLRDCGVAMCSNSESVRTISMAKPVKKGFLSRYKKRFIGSNWREEWIVLHDDSSLEWYSDHDESTLRGGITLKEAPEMIAAGPYASYVPGKPELPKNTEPNWLMVFGTKNKEETYWFLAANDDDLNQWMTAISNTLPPPPQPPQGATGGSSPAAPSAPPAPTAPLQPPAPGNLPPPYSEHAGGNGRSGGYPAAGGQPYGGGGGGYGRGGYGGGPYGGGGQNTVIIDRDRGGGGGMGDFASGMMLGTAMGTGLGWGMPGFGMGFGGWGLGMGFGVPMPSFGGRGGSVTNNETNITNTYNTTNYNSDEPDGQNDVNPNTEGTEVQDDGTGDAEIFNPDHGTGVEPTADEGTTGGVDDGLLSDEGGLEAGLTPLEPSAEPVENLIPEGVDPEFLQNSADGGVVGFQEPFTLDNGLEDDGGLDMGAPFTSADDYVMDYGDDGYDMMGGGIDLDMGGGYDFDMGGMDFGF